MKPHDGTPDPMNPGQKAAAIATYRERADDWEADIHFELMYEDAEYIVIADKGGHTVDEFADRFHIPKYLLRNYWAALARSCGPASWNTSDPLVFEKAYEVTEE